MGKVTGGKRVAVQRGKAWAVVRRIQGGEVVHKTQTTPERIDRTIGGMLINANRDEYYIDEWYEFPEKGQKDSSGKEKA
jgi:hypothetical protein